MNWGKVTFVFFTLMSGTSIAGFLYKPSASLLLIATAVNLISTILKVGVRNLLSAELLASSFVADLHLIPAFFYMAISSNIEFAIALSIGALMANIFSMALVLIESSKSNDDEDY